MNRAGQGLFPRGLPSPGIFLEFDRPFGCPTRLSNMPTSRPQEAFDLQELVAAHQGGMRRYLRFLRCPDDRVDDVVQEAFLALLRSNACLHEIEDHGAWLRQAARHRYLDERRRGRRVRSVGVEELDAVWARVALDNGNGYLAHLRSCLAELEQRERFALDLQYGDRRSRAEIGDELGLSIGGVKSLLMRAKEALRRCIGRKMAS